MKIDKDVILAIVIGVLVGGVTAFFVFFLPKFLPKSPSQTENAETVREEEEEEEASSPVSSSFLTLENPQNEAIFSEDEITVSGKTTPKALVVIISPTDEETIEADDKGGFEAKIALEEGANEISVTAYNEDDQEETESITVYYSEEEI